MSRQRKSEDASSASSELFKEQAAADFIQVQPGTLSVWRSQSPDKLRWIKVGRLVRYRKSDLEKFLIANERGDGEVNQ